MEKYLLVVNGDLDNYLKEKGYQPIYSNSERNRSIYVKSVDLSLEVNGWHKETNTYGKIKEHFDLNTKRGLEIELMMGGY